LLHEAISNPVYPENPINPGVHFFTYTYKKSIFETIWLIFIQKLSFLFLA
jgi:hypothetical protein